MSTKMKLVPVRGGRWAIARTTASGDFVSLIENSPVDSKEEIWQVMLALKLSTDKVALDTYFPRNHQGKRCPTFGLVVSDLGKMAMFDGMFLFAAELFCLDSIMFKHSFKKIIRRD